MKSWVIIKGAKLFWTNYTYEYSLNWGKIKNQLMLRSAFRAEKEWLSRMQYQKTVIVPDLWMTLTRHLMLLECTFTSINWYFHKKLFSMRIQGKLTHTHAHTLTHMHAHTCTHIQTHSHTHSSEHYKLKKTVYKWVIMSEKFSATLIKRSGYY